MEILNKEPIRRSDDLLFGRLLMLPSTTTLSAMQNWIKGGNANTVLSVDFPAMPDTIELARQADYVVNYNQVLPDGVHQYRGTAPLNIPISFKLHAEDPFCSQGSLTLLKIGARLHSFVLPISTQKGTQTDVSAQGADPATPRGSAPKGGSATQMEGQAEQAQAYQVVSNGAGVTATLYPPATCWLHLIYISETLPGISCVGYVKDVKVVFSGPWRRSSDDGFNLPSSAEFGFTFVHRPGHGNDTGGYQNSTVFPKTITDQPQAYSGDVLDSLYNTHGLTKSNGAANYKSVLDGPSASSAAVVPSAEAQAAVQALQRALTQQAQRSSITAPLGHDTNRPIIFP